MATLCIRKLFTSNLINKIHKYETLGAAAPSLCNITSLKYYNVTRHYSDKIKINGNLNKYEKNEKPSLFKRFKAMYRDYWYVLVPVHLVTSAAWFGGFYYAAKSGVDIVGILESWNVSPKITNSLKDSSMGYLAVSYALYKLATPVRYTVTLGGTTLSINYLRRWGYIKPVPTTDQLKEMYKERKENIMETFKETKGFYQEKKEDFIETVKDSKIEFHLKKDRLKNQKDTLVRDLEKSLRKIKKVNSEIAGKPNQYLKVDKKHKR